MIAYGIELNTLKNLENCWTPSQEWTPHSGRASILRTHIPPSTRYSGEHYPVHAPLNYSLQVLWSLLRTRWLTFKDYLLPTNHHAYNWNITAQSEVTLDFVSDYIIPTLTPTVSHRATLASRIKIHTIASCVTIPRMTPKIASMTSSSVTLAPPSDFSRTASCNNCLTCGL